MGRYLKFIPTLAETEGRPEPVGHFVLFPRRASNGIAECCSHYDIISSSYKCLADKI